MQKLMTLKEVAEKVDMSPKWVRKHTSKHAQPRLGFTRLGNFLKFSEEQVAEFLAHFDKAASKNEWPEVSVKQRPTGKGSSKDE